MDNVHELSNRYESLRRGLFLVLGGISAFLSMFFYPFVFGMLGVISGILATKNNKSRIGVFLVMSSIVLMGIGLAFSNKILYFVKVLF